jgi:hypothetical protein
MEEKINDLEKILEKHKHNTTDLTIEEILKDSKAILSKEDFFETWEALNEKQEQEEWINYNKNLI